MPSERELSEMLAEFARTMVTDFPIQAILDHLVKRAVEILPISAAGVTLISPGTQPRYIAASNGVALQFEKLQTELGSGPCLEAYLSGEAVLVPDLQREGRFPRFTSRALEAGLAAVFTFPLHHGDRRLGAFDLYRGTPGPLEASSLRGGGILADVAAAYLINAQGRADLQEASERSRFAALHDGLTGLPNRMLMLERLDHAFQRARRSGLTTAVLFVDVDRFKAVNDTFGHRTGDELLVAMTRRLTGLLRPGDTLARLSGDEFLILCEDLPHATQPQEIAGRLSAALAEPFLLSCGELDITASVGIAFTGEGSHTPEEVLDAADTAMYEAKRAGGDHHRVVDLRGQHRADHPVSLTADLGIPLESARPTSRLEEKSPERFE